MEFRYARRPDREILGRVDGIPQGVMLDLPRATGGEQLPRADTQIPERMEIPELLVYQYTDVALLPNNVILDGTLRYVYPSTFRKHRHHRHMGLIHKGDDVFVPRNKISKNSVDFVPGTSFYLDCEFSNIYGHYLLEVWPQLWAKYSVNISEVSFVTSVELPSYVLQVLEHLGVTRDRIHRITGLTRCETLIVPSYAVLARRYVHPEARKVFKEIARMAAFTTADEEARILDIGSKVYLSRSGIAGRGLVNEQAVEEVVKRSDFSVVRIEEYSIPAQMKILQNAEYIVGPGGSGMHNAIFATNPKVMILASEGWFTIADTLLSQGSYPLSYVFGQRLEIPADGSRSQDPWAIDLTSVEQGLEELTR